MSSTLQLTLFIAISSTICPCVFTSPDFYSRLSHFLNSPIPSPNHTHSFYSPIPLVFSALPTTHNILQHSFMTMYTHLMLHSYHNHHTHHSYYLTQSPHHHLLSSYHLASSPPKHNYLNHPPQPTYFTYLSYFFSYLYFLDLNMCAEQQVSHMCDTYASTHFFS